MWQTGFSHILSELLPSSLTVLCTCYIIQDHLPDGFQYQPASFTELPHSQYEACIRVNVKAPKGAVEWLAAYQEKNKVTFRKERGTSGKGRNLIYKSYLRCHHCTRPRSSTADLRRTSKNTRCPARLIVTLQRTDFLLKTLRKRHYIAKKSNTAHDNLFPCLIEIKHKHNHPLIAADTLNKRDVGNDVKAKLAEMFGNGHSPSSALSAHKLDLHLVHGDQYPFIAANRALCPDLQLCYRYDLIAGC